MKNFENVDEILDFAINEEQGAVDFYSELADACQNRRHAPGIYRIR